MTGSKRRHDLDAIWQGVSALDRCAQQAKAGADVDRQLSRTGSFLGGSIAVGALVSGGLVWWDPAARLGHPGHALDVAVWAFAGLNVVHLVASALLVHEPRAAVTSRRETSLLASSSRSARASELSSSWASRARSAFMRWTSASASP